MIPAKTHSLRFSLSPRRQLAEMLGVSKLAMGSAMVVATCLFLVFVLLLVLYVGQCCSSLRQRRRLSRHRQPPLPIARGGAPGGAYAPSFAKTQSEPQEDDVVAMAAGDGRRGGSPTSPLQKSAVSPSAAAYYAHGVLRTPPSFFFPSGPREEGEMQGSLQMSPRAVNSGLYFIGLIPSPFAARKGDDFDGRCSPEEHFVYISNPIFQSGGGGVTEGSTPFETPDTSPSRLEIDDDEDGGLEAMDQSGEESPPPKPMRKLPSALPPGTAAAFLAGGRPSLATSISATDTNRPSSSCSSSPPSTSPPW